MKLEHNKENSYYAACMPENQLIFDEKQPTVLTEQINNKIPVEAGGNYYY